MPGGGDNSRRGRGGNMEGAPDRGSPEFWEWLKNRAGGGGTPAPGGGGTPTPPAPLPQYPNAPVQQTFQPTLPGFMQMHADQLAAGFGGTPESQLAQLNSIYEPMSVMQFKEPISVTAENYKAGPGGTGSGRNMSRQDWLRSRLGGRGGGGVLGGSTGFAPISTGNPTLDKLLMGEGRVDTKSMSKGGKGSRRGGDMSDEDALESRVAKLEGRIRYR